MSLYETFLDKNWDYRFKTHSTINLPSLILAKWTISRLNDMTMINELLSLEKYVVSFIFRSLGFQ